MSNTNRAANQPDFDDVSYLVIQGSNDGDVQSYMGSAQYSRVGFDQTASAASKPVSICSARTTASSIRTGDATI